LLEVSSVLCKLLVDGIMAAPATNATYTDVVNQMLAISHSQSQPAIYRTFLRNRFTLREVTLSPTPLRAILEGRVDFADPNFTDGSDTLKLAACPHGSDKAPQDRSLCCGTMQLPEYTLDEGRLARRQPMGEADLLSREVAELKKAFAGG
jgi:hypothetical protein